MERGWITAVFVAALAAAFAPLKPALASEPDKPVCTGRDHVDIFTQPYPQAARMHLLLHLITRRNELVSPPPEPAPAASLTSVRVHATAAFVEIEIARPGAGEPALAFRGVRLQDGYAGHAKTAAPLSFSGRIFSSPEYFWLLHNTDFAVKRRPLGSLGEISTSYRVGVVASSGARAPAMGATSVEKGFGWIFRQSGRRPTVAIDVFLGPQFVFSPEPRTGMTATTTLTIEQ